MDDDPLFIPQLILLVKAWGHDFNNGFKDDTKLIDRELDELILELNLARQFFIFDTSCNIGGKNALTLKEVSKCYYNQ